MTSFSTDPRSVRAAPLVAPHKWAALAAAVLGMVLIFGAGFAPSDTVHNAAHDTRHAFAFPCH